MELNIRHFDIWLANLNPQRGTEIGKVRPILIVQTNLINNLSDSTLICPVTSKTSQSEITKVKIDPSAENGLKSKSWVIVDQIRSIDNRRLIRKLGTLSMGNRTSIRRSLKIILDLE
ncbi:type II toxin-antitoxin system PemK/MazF family toxin [Ekhidna sp.]|uniref:type II toxin-antitoxin system PemK/MazF family toxin n=1 Tax=Ekhidna sp. TaxID=2608089 RepID=UPI003CCB8B47